MKILIEISSGGAHRLERMGLARSCSTCHDVVLWNPEGKSIYDQVDEFPFDVFIGNGYQLSESLINVLLENTHVKCWLKLGDFGFAYNGKDLNDLQILTASETEKINVSRLTKKLRVWGGAHYWRGRTDTHSYWENYGVTPLHSTLASDVFLYTSSQEKPEYKSDIGCCSGFWKYKGRSIEEYLFPLMHPDNNFNIKVFGYGWPTSYYCGPIEEANEKHFYKSCTICVNIHERQALSLGFELNERSFKLLSNKCFVISDKPKDLSEQIFNNNEIVFADNPKDFRDKIEYYLKYPEKRQEFIERGYKKVIESETYFARAAYLMANMFGDIEEKKILDSYEKVKKELAL